MLKFNITAPIIPSEIITNINTNPNFLVGSIETCKIHSDYGASNGGGTIKISELGMMGVHLNWEYGWVLNMLHFLEW